MRSTHDAVKCGVHTVNCAHVNAAIRCGKMAGEKREQTFPVPQWWLDAVQQRMEEAKNSGSPWTQPRLVAELHERFGMTMSESRISRCIDGLITPQGLVAALSEILVVPAPFVIPASYAEALAIEGARYLFLDDREKAAIRASVDPHARVVVSHTDSAAIEERDEFKSADGGRVGRSGRGRGGVGAGGGRPKAR
jgi:hypothetical protein